MNNPEQSRQAVGDLIRGFEKGEIYLEDLKDEQVEKLRTLLSGKEKKHEKVFND